MTTSIWIDPKKPEIIDSLQPSPGFCIFIDIVGSAKLKEQGIRNWVAFIHNCFGNARLFLHPFYPLKGIGDSLMYFIEDSDLIHSGYTPLEIFDALWQIAMETDPNIPPVKIGAARCEHVYALTFLQGSQDYYGIDIDITARLQSHATEREIVIEERFYKAIATDYQATGNKEQFESFDSLRGPTRQELKGIKDAIQVFRARRA